MDREKILQSMIEHYTMDADKIKYDHFDNIKDIVENWTILERESLKYEFLHNMPKYGGRTGRVKILKRANDPLHNKFKEGLSKSNSLLDVGCGKGHFMDFYKRNYGLHCTGLDIAENIYRPDLNIVYGSASEMIFKDNQFDVVNFQDGFEHIPEELETQVMNEIYRVSNKYIYSTTAIHDVSNRHLDSYGLGKVHINMKSAKIWKAIFEKFAEQKQVKDFMFDSDKHWVFVYMEK